MTADLIWTWAYRLGELVLFAGVLWALGLLIKWLGPKAATSKLFAAVSWITVLVDGILSDVTVAVKPDIDAALADGTVTAAERAEINAKALATLKTSISTRGLSNLAGLLGIAGAAFTQWISGLVNNRLSVQLGTVPVSAAATTSTLTAAANAAVAAQAAQAVAVPR